MPKPNDKEIKHVYDNIAESFYNLRQKPITTYVNKLAEKWTSGLLLDVGCGVGISMLPFVKNGFDCIGIDISSMQLKFARQFARKHNVKFRLKIGNVTELPFDDNLFDYVVSAAVIHHLDNKKKRLRALLEMKRVLKNNGELFITVWNYNQSRFLKSKKDVYIPWTYKGIVHQRYYHLFSKEELKKLVEESGLKIVKIFEYDAKNNICVIAKNVINQV